MESELDDEDGDNAVPRAVLVGFEDDFDAEERANVRRQTKRRLEYLRHIREILLEPCIAASVATMEAKIHRALNLAATDGNVEARSTLCNRFRAYLKEWNANAENNDFFPLHQAAYNSHVVVVRLLVEEYGLDVNQINDGHDTPLDLAIEYNYQHHRWEGCVTFDRDYMETIHVLLQNGADPQRGGADYEFSPLYTAIRQGMPDVACLLLDYVSDLSHDPALEGEPPRDSDEHCMTELSIMYEEAELLDKLLRRGAKLRAPYEWGDNNFKTTMLNHLLLDDRREDKSKLEVLRVLIDYANSNEEGMAFMQSSLEGAIRLKHVTNTDSSKLILQAGLDPLLVLHRAIRQGDRSACEALVQHGIDPIEGYPEHASSPFHAAAQQNDTAVLELFLECWDQRYASNGGKNDDGDSPLHVICCDPNVSLEAIQLVVQRQAHIVTTVDGEQGLLPLHFAAMWDAKVDVIYHLLCQWPDALNRRLLAQSPVLSPGTNTLQTAAPNDKRRQDLITVDDQPLPTVENASTLGDGADGAPLTKKAKTTF